MNTIAGNTMNKEVMIETEVNGSTVTAVCNQFLSPKYKLHFQEERVLVSIQLYLSNK